MTPPHSPPNPGLCRGCQNARLVKSARGSVFLLCQAPKSFQLPKYPPLPVITCPAFSPEPDKRADNDEASSQTPHP